MTLYRKEDGEYFVHYVGQKLPDWLRDPETRQKLKLWPDHTRRYLNPEVDAEYRRLLAKGKKK
jgi:hypothetical protein